MTKRTWQYMVGGLVVLLLIIQLVPGAAADNPPVEDVITVPGEVMAVLRQSCWDCHSHETEWPWYSHVAPMKWLVRGHVEDARSELNFTAWNRYDVDDKAHKWEEVAEEVEEGHMPLRSYLFLHRDAQLSAADRETLIRWAVRQAGGGPEGGPGAEERSPAVESGS